MQSHLAGSDVGSVRWSTPSIALHWSSAVLIVALVTVGFVKTDLAADSSLRLWLSPQLPPLFVHPLRRGGALRRVPPSRAPQEAAVKT